MGIKEFLKECHNRSLFKLLSVYIVSGWVIIQVFSVINEPLNIPNQVITYVILLLLVGLPFYMFILWRVKLKDSAFNSEESVISNINGEISFKRKYFISIALIATVTFFSAAVIYENSFANQPIELEVEDSSKIAVLDFNNNTGKPELDVIGNMSSDWIVHGITEYSSGEVISPESLKNYAELMGVQFEPNLNNNFFDKILRPDKLITGSYYINGDELVFNCVIQNVKDNTILIAFPKVSCNKENALECIEEIKQKVLGYLYGEQDFRLSLQDDPPKFEAYEKKLMADTQYENDDLYITLLDESIALDSSYFEPQILRVQYYYNQGEFKKSDSLNNLIAHNPKLSLRQKNLLNFLEALIAGKNDKVYKKLKYEYDIAPFHLETNSSIMVILNQFINRPELVEEVFNEIDMADFEIDNCVHCKYRYLMMGTAFNSLKQFNKTIDLLEPVLDESEYLRLDLIYIDALIKSENLEKLQILLDNRNVRLASDELIILNKFIGDRYLLASDTLEANKYYQKILSNKNASDLDKVHVFYNLKQYNKALPLLKNLSEKDTTSSDILSKLASIYFINGQEEDSKSIIENIKSKRIKYDYGNTDYLLAEYYATIGEDDKAINSLLKSVANGNFYFYNNLQNDPTFKNILTHPKFNYVLTYWH